MPTVPVPVANRPRKGALTRAAILEAALAIAGRDGLEGLTIGGLAEAMTMSKSGVLAHFGSREELQRAALAEYGRRFVAEVLSPALSEARGLPRLQAILARWLRRLARELDAGCIMIGGAFEYDNRTGLLHDAVRSLVSGWQQEVQKAIRMAIDAGHLRRGTDPQQMVFEIYGLMLATHQSTRLLRTSAAIRYARAGVQRLLAAACTTAGMRLARWDTQRVPRVNRPRRPPSRAPTKRPPGRAQVRAPQPINPSRHRAQRAAPARIK
jgi:AcrR family transcriptional regulator